MDTQADIDTARIYLTGDHDVRSFERRGLHLYFDSPTGAWWMVTDDDLETLGRMISAETPDLLGRWAGACPAVEVDLDQIVGEWDLDENSDLDAVQREAAGQLEPSARGDMTTFMALAFLRDEVEQTIEQNAEIAGEAA